MYIRTKDGIFEATECNEDGSCWCLNDGGKYFEKAEILNQANTIAELCDGFYNDILGEGIFNFDPLYLYTDFDNFKDDFIGYRVYDDWNGNGYGFIKTSKGLIYVAKLNESGVLELI